MFIRDITRKLCQMSLTNIITTRENSTVLLNTYTQIIGGGKGAGGKRSPRVTFRTQSIGLGSSQHLRPFLHTTEHFL